MPEPDRNGSYKPVFAVEGLVVNRKCRVHVLWVIIPFLVLLSLQIGVVCWILHGSEAKPHITVVIDMNGTQRCATPPSIMAHPCIKNMLYITSPEPIGPLRCRDDAFVESVGASGGLKDSCHGNAFRIASDGKGVVIPKDGMYRVYAKVTFYDEINHHTSVSLRIDPPRLSGCLGNHACLEARESLAHTWLTCQSHQPPGAAKGSRDFAGCAIDGIRRFSAGEIVSLQVAIGYREISGNYKSTYMYLHKL